MPLISRTLELDLSGLDLSGKEMTVCRDGAEGHGVQVEAGLKPPADGKISVALRSGGGFWACIREPKTYAGWK